jgi:hypothetical protein
MQTPEWKQGEDPQLFAVSKVTEKPNITPTLPRKESVMVSFQTPFGLVPRKADREVSGRRARTGLEDENGYDPTDWGAKSVQLVPSKTLAK